jgi:hypothetical protein
MPANLWAIMRRLEAIDLSRAHDCAQAALASAKKLSGESASSGVNCGSKRNCVPQ